MPKKSTLQHAPAGVRVIGRVGRHLRWARAGGVGRLVEEDNLDPRARVAAAMARRRWRRANPRQAGEATAVLLVGVQRSGTNMVVRGLEQSGEFEVHNENDRKMFSRYLLRSDDIVRGVVHRSRQRFVLLKPLCDSHRTPELLDALTTASPAKAIWAYRAAAGRASSAVEKFGDANLNVLRDIAEGRADQRWQAQRLSAENRALVESFDYSTLDATSAAALFWYVRNSLYFDLALDRRDDVLLVSYDRFVAHPTSEMERLAAFLDIAADPALVAHVGARNSGTQDVQLHPRVRKLCDELEERLGHSVTQ